MTFTRRAFQITMVNGLNHHGLLLKSPWSFSQITMVIFTKVHSDRNTQCRSIKTMKTIAQ
jgi:hypothetical protein